MVPGIGVTLTSGVIGGGAHGLFGVSSRGRHRVNLPFLLAKIIKRLDRCITGVYYRGEIVLHFLSRRLFMAQGNPAVQIRLANERKAVYLKSANSEGLSLVDWIRLVCDKAAGYKMEKKDIDQVPFSADKGEVTVEPPTELKYDSRGRRYVGEGHLLNGHRQYLVVDNEGKEWSTFESPS